MKFLAEQYEDDAEASAVYASNASALASSARQISNRIESLNKKSSTRSVEASIDNFTQMAQTQMIAYNQMAQNLAAQEKKAEAAEASYRAAVTKHAAGFRPPRRTSWRRQTICRRPKTPCPPTGSRKNSSGISCSPCLDLNR